MFTLKQIRNISKNLLFLNFQETGPKSPIETTDEQILESLTQEEKQLEELKKQLEILKAQKTIQTKQEESLRKGLLIKGDPQDPEYHELAGKVKRLQESLRSVLTQEQELQVKIDKMQKEAQNLLGDIKKEFRKVSEKEIDSLSRISSKEFLEISKEKRLTYITKNNVESFELISGDVKNIEFTFTFNGKFNKELYLETTAGQVLPREVREVKVGDRLRKRDSLQGEFFNGNTRLTIHEGTKLEVTKLTSAEDLEKMVASQEKKLSKYKNTPDEHLARTALNSSIEIDFFVSCFKGLVSKEKQNVDLEYFATDVERLRGKYRLDISNDSQELELRLLVLKKYHKDSWEQKAEEMGINKKDIENFKRKNTAKNNFEQMEEKEDGEGTEFVSNSENIDDEIEELNQINLKILAEKVAEKYGIPTDVFKSLINKESAWNPTAKPPKGSAYGLGQMIDDTWARFGKGLNRNDSKDQLIASAKYLSHIRNSKNCSWEAACAYYNTGEGFKIDSSPAPQNYIKGNPAIAKLIPPHRKDNPTREDYFKAAAAYYSGQPFEKIVV